MGAQSAFLGRLFQHLFFIPFFVGFWVPPGSPNPGVGGRAADPLVVWESDTLAPLVVKSLWENSIFQNSAFPSPLGEGNY